MGMVGFGADGILDRQIRSGRSPLLIEVGASNLSDGCAVVTLRTGAAMARPPKFDGSDKPVPMSGATPVVLPAAIRAGFLTTLPPREFQPTQMTPLMLSMATETGIALPLNLYGVHVQGTITPTNLDGELHGVMRQPDVNSQLVPAMAREFTAQVNRNSTGPALLDEKMIVAYFEDQSMTASKSKCTSTPTMCCANNPTTCQITASELMQHSALMSLLAPDVQTFQNGAWGPVPGGGSKDASSMGFSLSAVKAAF